MNRNGTDRLETRTAPVGAARRDARLGGETCHGSRLGRGHLRVQFVIVPGCIQVREGLFDIDPKLSDRVLSREAELDVSRAARPVLKPCSTSTFPTSA